MNLSKCGYRSIAFFLFLLIVTFTLAKPAIAQVEFTEAEKNYIENTPTLQAVSINGIAPLLYINNKGEVVGIFKEILDLISNSTGLNFELKLYESVTEAANTNYDLFVGTDPTYTRTTITTKPILQSETVLFMNSKVNIDNLDKKILAIVDGAISPEGIEEKYIARFGTREKVLDAIEKGQADYGHGNAYSVAYYTMQNNYQHVITVPIATQDRQYSIGLAKENPILLSILNKAIDTIEDQQIYRIILSVASEIEQKITLPLLAKTYGVQIVGTIAIIIIALSTSAFISLQIARKLSLQNERYLLLSQISNEYLYEYYFNTGELHFSEQLKRFLKENGFSAEVEKELRTILVQEQTHQDQRQIKLTTSNGQNYALQLISSTIKDRKGRPHSIIGKLVDVTTEVSEKQKLLSKSQIDGLTGLYNANTIKELVIAQLNKYINGQIDALMVLDLDRLKTINDNFGHLIGDKVLKEVGIALKTTFRRTDLIGRIGGDEFIIHLENIPSIELIKIRCEEINTHLKTAFPEVPVSTSTGVAIIGSESDYDSVFEIADQALYQAKRQGLGNTVIEIMHFEADHFG